MDGHEFTLSCGKILPDLKQNIRSYRKIKPIEHNLFKNQDIYLFELAAKDRVKAIGEFDKVRKKIRGKIHPCVFEECVALLEVKPKKLM